MMDISTKLTQKYQTTIPFQVRELLELDKGDMVTFEISDSDRVILKKQDLSAEKQYAQALQSTLSEWGSEDDDLAYDSL